MPAFGLIPDSPWIYYGQKVTKGIKNSGRSFATGGGRSSWRFGKVRIYDMVLWQVLKGQGRGGLVANHLRLTGTYITSRAKIKVGKRTGRLASSIKMEPLTAHGYGMKLRVTAKNKIAYIHHEGARPHIIEPREPDGVLVFRKGTRIIRTRMVNHPGSKPNPYLREPMEEAIRFFSRPGPF